MGLWNLFRRRASVLFSMERKATSLFSLIPNARATMLLDSPARTLDWPRTDTAIIYRILDFEAIPGRGWPSSFIRSGAVAPLRHILPIVERASAQPCMDIYQRRRIVLFLFITGIYHAVSEVKNRAVGGAFSLAVVGIVNFPFAAYLICPPMGRTSSSISLHTQPGDSAPFCKVLGPRTPAATQGVPVRWMLTYGLVLYWMFI